MPKSKKRKAGHHTANQNGELSHAEIWDDSALIRSWNDAYAEYEYYHSIHTKGEDVEEILRQAEAEDVTSNMNTKSQASEEGEIDDDDNDNDNGDHFGDSASDMPTNKHLVNEAILNESDSITVIEEEEQQRQQRHRLITPKVDSPKTQIGSQVFTTHDESTLQDRQSTTTLDQTGLGAEGVSASADQTLENLKMAYYWAGYYSGLYDGQKQATTQSQPHGTEQKQNPT